MFTCDFDYYVCDTGKTSHRVYKGFQERFSETHYKKHAQSMSFLFPGHLLERGDHAKGVCVSTNPEITKAMSHVIDGLQLMYGRDPSTYSTLRDFFVEFLESSGCTVQIACIVINRYSEAWSLTISGEHDVLQRLGLVMSLQE